MGPQAMQDVAGKPQDAEVGEERSHIPVLALTLWLNPHPAPQVLAAVGCQPRSHFNPVTQSFCYDQTVQGKGDGEKGKIDIGTQPSGAGEHRGRQQDSRKRQLPSPLCQLMVPQGSFHVP